MERRRLTTEPWSTASKAGGSRGANEQDRMKGEGWDENQDRMNPSERICSPPQSQFFGNPRGMFCSVRHLVCLRPIGQHSLVLSLF